MNYSISRRQLLVGITALSFLGISPQQTFAAKTESSMSVQQSKKITGTIADAQGPIIGATVKIKGTNHATVTDLDGNYTLNVNAGQTIEITYVGYVMKTIKITAVQRKNLEHDLN